MRFNPRKSLVGVVLGGVMLSACSEDVDYSKRVTPLIDDKAIVDAVIRPKGNTMEETCDYIKYAREALEEGNIEIAEGYVDSALVRSGEDITFSCTIMELYGDIYARKGDFNKAAGFYGESFMSFGFLNIPFQSGDSFERLIFKWSYCLDKMEEQEKNRT